MIFRRLIGYLARLLSYEGSCSPATVPRILPTKQYHGRLRDESVTLGEYWTRE